MSSTILAVSRLGKFLSQRYVPYLDLSDSAATMQEGDEVGITRALAAHCISRLGRLDPEDAAGQVTDGFDDLGIDALYYDRPSKMLYIVQAKWSSNGAKKISEVDATKTLNGLRSVLSVDLDRANERLKQFRADCEDAANDNETRYTVVFATTANESLGETAKNYVLREIERIAGISGLVLYEEFNRVRLYETLTAASEPNKICLTVELEEWAEVAEPLSAYSGRVSLATVLEWQKHGYSLFHKNVRGFLSDQELFSSLTTTLVNNPEHFWYFNNGATLLCDQVKKRPLHGSDRRRGIFDLCGVSVVNGAQTIGIVWRFAGDGSTLDPAARLPLRLISLQGAAPDFATQVTRALNTQKRIDARDFVALDPLQQRLRRDMSLDGRTYVYRSGESPIGDESKTCTFSDAATALACAHGDIELAVKAKRVISDLWASTTEEPYTLLFPPSLDAETVWRAVKIQRAIQATITAMRDKSTGRSKTILSHGNRFIVYKVFKIAALRRFRDHREPLSDLESVASKAAERTAARICEVLNGAWSQETVQYVFKYTQKCRDLDKLTSSDESQTPPAKKSSQLSFLDGSEPPPATH